MVRAPSSTRKCDHAHSAANTNSEVRKNFLKRSGGLRLRSGYALPEPEAAAAPSLILIVAESYLDCRAAGRQTKASRVASESSRPVIAWIMAAVRLSGTIWAQSRCTT